MEERDVEADDRVGPVDRRLGELERPPAAIHEHPHRAPVVRFARLRRPHVANAPEPFEKLLGREAGEILDDAVVGKDAELVVRKDDGEEAAVFLAASVPRVRLR